MTRRVSHLPHAVDHLRFLFRVTSANSFLSVCLMSCRCPLLVPGSCSHAHTACTCLLQISQVLCVCWGLSFLPAAVSHSFMMEGPSPEDVLTELRERGRGREKKGEKNIICLPPIGTLAGDKPTNWACALTGDRTGDLWV